jgi:hypothetical protein
VHFEIGHEYTKCFERARASVSVAFHRRGSANCPANSVAADSLGGWSSISLAPVCTGFVLGTLFDPTTEAIYFSEVSDCLRNTWRYNP